MDYCVDDKIINLWLNIIKQNFIKKYPNSVLLKEISKPQASNLFLLRSTTIKCNIIPICPLIFSVAHDTFYNKFETITSW